MTTAAVIKSASAVLTACAEARAEALFLLAASESEPDLSLRQARLDRLLHKAIDANFALRALKRSAAANPQTSETL